MKMDCVKHGHVEGRANMLGSVWCPDCVTEMLRSSYESLDLSLVKETEREFSMSSRLPKDETEH